MTSTSLPQEVYYNTNRRYLSVQGLQIQIWWKGHKGDTVNNEVNYTPYLYFCILLLFTTRR